MSIPSHHPGRVASLALAAVAIAALAVNGPVAAGESAGSADQPTAVVTEVGDMAPMIEPMEDVDDSDAAGDVAPMIEPLEDVAE